MILSTIALLFSISSLISLPSIKAYADRFDDIDPIQIKKENGKEYEIDADYIQAFNDPQVLKNDNAKGKKIKFNYEEEIEISYKDPCGSMDFVKALFLKWQVTTPGSGEDESVELEGKQIEFYDDKSPPDGDDTVSANIPDKDDIKKGKYKLVAIVSCDDDLYHVTNAKIK